MKTLGTFVITVALIAGLVGCAPAPTPTRYNLTMAVAPAGSGNATDLTNASPCAADTVVNITAAAAVGYQFVNWTAPAGTFANATATPTTFTMPAQNVTVTANFALKPAEIRTWYDLDAIRDNLDGSYILMNDLNSTTAGYEELSSPTANTGNGWEPIGTEPEPFTGGFRGQGHKIKDLFVDRPGQDYVGLFGYVGAGGVIEQVGAVNVVVVGYGYVGGLAGRNDGTVSDSQSTGSVSGGYCIGGLVGQNDGAVSNSYSGGNVTAGWDLGGLIGANGWYEGQATVSNSHYCYGEVLINGRNAIGIGALFNEDFEQWLANGKSLDVNDRLSQEDGYYVIDDVGDLKQLLAFGQDDSLRFSLEADVDLAGEPDFYIPYLAGEFDGNGHSISNLNFNLWFLSRVGLFGYIASSGKVTDVRVETVNVTGRQAVGGLAGWNEGTVSDSYSAGGVTASYGSVGGLVGTNDGTVSNSYSAAGVTAECCWAGGLIGENSGIVSNSYSTGSVTAGESDVGGLVGSNFWGGTVSNSHYNYDEVLINGRNLFTIGALFNEDFEQWLANGKFLDVNERLSQEDGYYVIDDVGDFKQLLPFGQDDSLRFRLEADVDLAADSDFYIPYLAGEFDGNGHKIANLSFGSDFSAQVGLFGYLASGAKVTGVGVENANIAGAGSLGGLVGWNEGAVSNSYSMGEMTGGSAVGGLVGDNSGTVSNSYSIGSVTSGYGVGGGLVGRNSGTVSDSYSTARVTGGLRVGGLVGYNRGSVSNSYSTGSVTGSTEVGGLVGRNRDAVNASLWDAETSGQSASDGGTGKTTAQMKSITTFSGAAWNICAVANPSARNPSCIWNIVDGQTYPFLSWQATPLDTLQVKDVTAQEAFELIQENHGNPDFIILDVRTSLEFHDGHIEGALNIDVNLPSFSQELERLDRNATYLVYCRSGNRSRTALGIMEALGFTRIYHLANGITEWVAAGLPVSQ